MTSRHLKEEMEALKKALEAEKEKTAQAIATANSKKEDEDKDASKEMITPILVAPYRQMPRFSGCSDKAGVPSVQEWVMDMRGYLSAKRSSKAEKAACVVGHLTGKARQEIVARGESVTSSAEEIFQALVRVFGDGFTLPQLQQRFFS